MSVKRTTTSKAGWNFDNSYTRLPNVFYTRIDPDPVSAPQLVVLNERLAASLGLDVDALRSEEGVAVFAGNRIPEGGAPLAQAYAGHQFGYFTMLGDGRAHLLGEQLTPQGERKDVQLKGSGRTPYSRGGDGRAALGPMLREYIISEAMHALGIPTTRSLAVVTTGEPVYRETELAGAILTRIATSHVRVGTFQYAARFCDVDDFRALADYTWQRHFAVHGAEEGDNRYLSLLRETIRRQAALIARWQLVGFIHGVMNTDNMAIGGETIDYGPCAFINEYDPKTVFSSIDTYGRYAYGNQPRIGVWNLARFAEALLPLIDDDEKRAIELAEQELAAFSSEFKDYWLRGMRAKLGLFQAEDEDEALIQELLELMHRSAADYTNTFLALTFDRMEAEDWCATPEFIAWKEKWRVRQQREPQSDAEAHQLMRENNPALIPRNHRVEEALAAAVNGGDLSVMERLVAALAEPYAHTPEQAQYASPPAPSSVPYRTFCGT